MYNADKVARQSPVGATLLLPVLRLCKSRVGVLEKHLEVRVEPGTGLRCWLEGRSLTAGGIVTGSRGVRGTVRLHVVSTDPLGNYGGANTYLTAGLDPDECVDERITSVGSRTGTKTSTRNIAPVAPLVLAGGLLAAASNINDEAGRETLLLQKGSKRIDVALLIAVGVLAGDGRASAVPESIVVGHVGDDTTDSAGRSSSLVYLSEQLRRRLNVGRPAEPSSVATVEVHVDVCEVEGFDGVCSEVLVVWCSLGALRHTHIGDHVGEGVGFCFASVQVFLQLLFSKHSPIARLTFTSGYFFRIATILSMYSVLYRLAPLLSIASSPFDASAAQSRSGRLYTTNVPISFAPAAFFALMSAR